VCPEVQIAKSHSGLCESRIGVINVSTHQCEFSFEPLRAWFTALYEVLLGQSQGPRFGSFAAIFGIDRTVALIERALAGELIAA